MVTPVRRPIYYHVVYAASSKRALPQRVGVWTHIDRESALNAVKRSRKLSGHTPALYLIRVTLKEQRK
jgi:hypothetical protein